MGRRIPPAVIGTLTALALSTMVAGDAHAQRVVIGIKGGANFSSISTKQPELDDASSRTAPLFGGFVSIRTGDLGWVQPEGYFSKRGFKLKEEGTDLTVESNYIEIPLLLKGQWRLNEGVMAGLYLGAEYLIQTSCRLKGVAKELEVSTDCESAPTEFDLKGSDFGVLFGLELQLPLGPASFILDGRLNWGLKNLSASDEVESIKSRVWTAMAGIGIPIAY